MTTPTTICFSNEAVGNKLASCDMCQCLTPLVLLIITKKTWLFHSKWNQQGILTSSTCWTKQVSRTKWWMYVEKLWAEIKRPWVICMNVVWYERLECLWMTGAMCCLSIMTVFHMGTNFRYQRQEQSDQDKVLYQHQQHYSINTFSPQAHVVCMYVCGHARMCAYCVCFMCVYLQVALVYIFITFCYAYCVI